MNAPTNPEQQEFNFNIVHVEPDLQITVALMPPEQRRALAKIYRRWSHQLEISASVLEHHRGPWRRRSLPRISPAVRRQN